MKELNSAYQTSFNQAIPKIETFLRTHHKFVYSNFDRFCSQNKVKYRANWFSLLRKVEVVKKTDNGWKYYKVISDPTIVEKLRQAFGEQVEKQGGKPWIDTGKPATEEGFKRNIISKNTTKTKANENIEEDLIDSAIRLLSQNGYSVFKFHWCYTSQTDDNSVKVVGYYNLNQK